MVQVLLGVDLNVKGSTSRHGSKRQKKQKRHFGTNFLPHFRVFCLESFFGTERPAALGVGKLMPAGWWWCRDSLREKGAFPIGGKGGGRGEKAFRKVCGEIGGSFPFPLKRKRKRGSRSQVFLRGVARDCEFSEVPERVPNFAIVRK